MADSLPPALCFPSRHARHTHEIHTFDPSSVQPSFPHCGMTSQSPRVPALLCGGGGFPASASWPVSAPKRRWFVCLSFHGVERPEAPILGKGLRSSRSGASQSSGALASFRVLSVLNTARGATGGGDERGRHSPGAPETLRPPPESSNSLPK